MSKTSLTSAAEPNPYWVPSMVRIKKVDSGRDRVFKTEESVNMKE